ncbi:MAG: PspC domain-containing protein [Cryomorphaceae bacterium]|nr:PspC domain-containing protein [Cryomorphaceae bacterium]MBT3684263.1 PspC domain-containing protein [Cryomorphaceae bacterium]MBT4236643.1 PspC domain-containing protein [Cryomorphaceae bacterium]MBT4813121.1 PspC domain-containing protein [Cryomorphaceae bacterium]MBT5417513.1 PspC domain-containing protein [Cryomorphaceae bacterium]
MIEYIEKYSFGVCDRIAKKIGIRTSTLRFLFFYFSIITLLLGFILYLIIALIFKVKDLIIHRKKTAFDL